MKITKTVKGRTVTCKCKQCVVTPAAFDLCAQTDVENALALLSLAKKNPSKAIFFVGVAESYLQSLLERMSK